MDIQTGMMSNRASFTSLPREIRDQIYRKVLVHSGPEYMFYDTARSGAYPFKPGHGLLNPAFSNRRIARAACEVYFGDNTFNVLAEKVPWFLGNKFDLGDGEWFVPAAYLGKVILNTRYCVRADSKALSLGCPKLKTIVLPSFANGNPPVYHRRCVRLSETANIVYLGRKLKSDVRNVELELYLHDFCYCRPPPPEQAFGPIDRCIILDGTRNVSWLIDIPDQAMIEKVQKDQGSDREWLVVQMATNWARIGDENNRNRANYETGSRGHYSRGHSLYIG